MPFTPAHAAAAWPIARIAPALPLAPLVIGTLSPDFEYLLRLTPRSVFGHSIGVSLLFCLPASLVGWAVFVALLRPALFDLLPPALGAAATETRSTGRARHFALGCAAALAGALTHLVWDGFTHEKGWTVGAVSILRTTVVHSASGDLLLFKVLQHTSTVLGTLIVGVWLSQAWQRLPADARRFTHGQAVRTALIVAALAVPAAVEGYFNGMRARTGPGLATIGFAAVGAMVGLLLAMAAFGAYVRARNWLR
jgi:hypothetical protein